MLGKDEILHRFGFHKATIEGIGATASKHRDLRLQFIEFAGLLDTLIPDGRHKEFLWYELENASMWAHKAIAQNGELVDETRPILACEKGSINCNGPVQNWYIPPDDKTPHMLCQFHVAETNDLLKRKLGQTTNELLG